MKPLLLALLAIPALASCESKADPQAMNPAQVPDIPPGHEMATLGAGCYWCIEAAYRQLDGVHSAISGFTGGHVPNPGYDEVCEGTTGHAEVVRIVFNPQKISYEKILAWFWELHDPTTLNRQGNDVGTQYRSAIFYHSPAQKDIAEASKKAAASLFTKPVVTEITAASTFYPAPNLHQDYYFQNKSKNPYCRYVIEPKLKKLNLKH